MLKIHHSRWERFHFWLFGRWPQSVVDKRLDQLHYYESLERRNAVKRRLFG